MSTLVLKGGVLMFQSLPPQSHFLIPSTEKGAKTSTYSVSDGGVSDPSDCRTCFKGCTENEGKGSFGCLRGASGESLECLPSGFRITILGLLFLLLPTSKGEFSQ